MNRSNKLNFILLVGMLFLCGFTSAAHAQTSRIKGRTVLVTGNVKKALPNVPVRLRGDVLAGNGRETVSDEEGNYLFPDLIAGDYTVSVELQVIESYERRVPVQLNSTADLNIELKPRDVSESVTVTDTTTPDEAKDTASVPSVVTNETLQNAPLIDERFQDALPLLPGVVRTGEGQLSIKGARENQSGALVSSLNVTDPVTGAPAIEIPLDAVDTIQVYSNPYSAEYGRFTGAIVQIETRAGTNEFKFVGSNILPRFRNINGATVGIERFTPRIAFSGPIVKDKLFFFQSFEYRFIRTPNFGLRRVRGLRADTRQEAFDSFTRLDYAINARHRLTASFSLFPQKIDFFDLNFFTPQESTANFHQRGYFIALNEQAVFGDGYLLQSNASLKQFDADIFPNDTAPYRITPEGVSGGYFNRQNRISRRYELFEILNLPTFNLRGTHRLKVGLNLSHTNFNGTEENQPVRVARRDGSTSELIQFSGDGKLARTNFETALFVQDKWTPTARVTFDLGARFDRDRIGHDNNIAPRFGFAVIPTGDFKTVVRGGGGLFYDKIPLGVGEFENYQDRRDTSFGFNGRENVERVRNFRNVVARGDFANPRSVAFNIQIDRELTSKLLVRGGYEERHTTRDFRLDPQAGGGLSRTVVIDTIGIPPTVRNIDNDILLLSDTGRARYREFQLLGKFRLQERRDIFVSYVRSRAEGDTNDFNTYFGNLRNPLIRPNEYTLQPFNVPHRFLAYGNVGLPFDITVLPVVDYRTGFPFSVLNEEQFFVGARNRGGRFPAFFSFDVQATIGVRVPFRGKTYRGRAGFKVFNVTNHFNPRDVQNNADSDTFGALYNSVGRQFRFKFEFLKF